MFFPQKTLFKIGNLMIIVNLLINVDDRNILFNLTPPTILTGSSQHRVVCYRHIKDLHDL